MDGNNNVEENSLVHIKNDSEQGPSDYSVDFLPADLLNTLSQPVKQFQDLGPGAAKERKKNKKNVITTATRDPHPKRPVDCVWHHANARSRFKHMVDQTPCTCGAGGDISFLCDAPAEKKKQKELLKLDTDQDISKGVPESLIPSEFHIIKSKGVVGLEVHDDKYTTTTSDHENHRTIFPSMKPAGRQEAIQLLNTMDSLLRRAGVTDEIDTVDMHNGEEESSSHIRELLQIVRDEQNIYNIVFNEIIRQVSIECVERGSVLAKLRQRYAALLDRIPKQVKNLHEEVLAQRALDRRLTEELSRFKSSVSLLTRELHEVQDHDREVTKQAVETQKELNSALKESEKNASLLAEYHDLYELQRRRLDRQIGKLIEERDLWSGCAYMLSTKVAAKHNLVTAKRLHLHERAWCKLTSHFVVLLAEHDARELQKLTLLTRDWQDIVDSFDETLRLAETAASKRMKGMQAELRGWASDFTRVVTPDEGTVHPPDSFTMTRLFETFRSWEELLNTEMERFQGEALLICEDSVLKMSNCVDSWTVVAQKLFQHHPTTEPEQEHPQSVSMGVLNKQIEQMHQRYRLRMSGENGVAGCMIHVINCLDTWVNKLNTCINGGDPLFESEWMQLADYLQNQWCDSVNEIITLLGENEDKEDEETSRTLLTTDESAVPVNSVPNVDEMFEYAQKWLNETMNSIENQDSNFTDQLLNVHAAMVRWMITILLRLAPDMPTLGSPPTGQQDGGGIAPPSAVGLGAAILAESTVDAIQEKYDALIGWLQRLTALVHACVKDLVKQDSLSGDSQASLIQNKQSAKDLQKMQAECTGWIAMAKLLINVLTGVDEPQTSERKFDEEAGENGDQEVDETGTGGDSDQEQTQEMELVSLDGDVEEHEVAAASPIVVRPSSVVGTGSPSARQPSVTYLIGHDDNVKQVEGFVEMEPSLDNMMLKPSSAGGGQALSVESLNALQSLQEKLLETEARAQTAEQRAYQAESDLAEITERLKSTEKLLERTKNAKKKKKDESPEKVESKTSKKSSLVAAEAAKKYSSTTAVGPVKKSSTDTATATKKSSKKSTEKLVKDEGGEEEEETVVEKLSPYEEGDTELGEGGEVVVEVSKKSSPVPSAEDEKVPSSSASSRDKSPAQLSVVDVSAELGAPTETGAGGSTV